MITFAIGTAAVVTGLSIFQFVVLPIAGFITTVAQWAKDQTK